jgi:hypothetical protein
MTLPEQVKEQYRLYGREEWFREDLERLLKVGYVHSTPEVFVAARPVPVWWPREMKGDPYHLEEGPGVDCWHIYMLAGDLKKAFTFLPFPLTYLSYERRGKIRLHNFINFTNAVQRSPRIPPRYPPDEGRGARPCSSKGNPDSTSCHEQIDGD